MPGCCGIVISTGAFVYPPFRRKGVGSILNTFRIELAKTMGFGLMMCTDVLKNNPQQKILDKNNWERIHTFTNPRTNNLVGIHVVNLQEE